MLERQAETDPAGTADRNGLRSTQADNADAAPAGWRGDCGNCVVISSRESWRVRHVLESSVEACRPVARKLGHVRLVIARFEAGQEYNLCSAVEAISTHLGLFQHANIRFLRSDSLES